MKLLKEALANCEQGARLSPNDAESWFNLGRVRLRVEEYGRRPVTRWPSGVAGPGRLRRKPAYALMLIANGETAKAVPYLQKAHDLRPRDEDVARLLRKHRDRRNIMQAEKGAAPGGPLRLLTG